VSRRHPTCLLRPRAPPQSRSPGAAAQTGRAVIPPGPGWECWVAAAPRMFTHGPGPKLQDPGAGPDPHVRPAPLLTAICKRVRRPRRSTIGAQLRAVTHRIRKRSGGRAGTVGCRPTPSANSASRRTGNRKGFSG
jgi:hypothetical protein